MKAKAVYRPTPGKMNKSEALYAEHLEERKAAGEILEFRFEPFAIILADRCRYHPDFLVINADQEIELHEFKGFWRDDARVKVKVAARQNPWFWFKIVKKRAKKDGGGFSIEAVNP